MHVWFTWRKFAKKSRLARLANWHTERQALVDEFKHKINVFNSKAEEERHSINKMKDQVEELENELVAKNYMLTVLAGFDPQNVAQIFFHAFEKLANLSHAWGRYI